jgi:hypothetical protein
MLKFQSLLSKVCFALSTYYSPMCPQISRCRGCAQEEVGTVRCGSFTFLSPQVRIVDKMQKMTETVAASLRLISARMYDCQPGKNQHEHVTEWSWLYIHIYLSMLYLTTLAVAQCIQINDFFRPLAPTLEHRADFSVS